MLHSLNNQKGILTAFRSGSIHGMEGGGYEGPTDKVFKRNPFVFHNNTAVRFVQMGQKQGYPASLCTAVCNILSDFLR